MADPNYSNVSLLLHCNGADASTTFTDTGPVVHTVTAAGNAQIDTAQSKWGGASGFFDGSNTNDYLSVPNAASLDLSSGDFTIEAWVRCQFDASSWGTGDISLQDKSSGTYAPWMLFLQDSGSGTYNVAFEAVNGSDSAVVSLLHGTGFAEDTWVHVAVTRSGSTFRLFLNGASPVSGTSAATLKTSTAALLLGGGHAGWLDDIRLTKGVARYTAAFTPPSAQFETGAVTYDARVAENPGPLSTDARLLGASGGAYVSAASMLGDARLLTSNVHTLVAAASPLGAAAAVAFSDWTSRLEPLQPLQFVLDLVTPAGDVRVPMSSWQATLTTSGECYAACVIPAALSWLSVLEVATEFVISRRVALSGSIVIFDLLIRCPMGTLQIDQGPVNGTASLSGYFDEIPADDEPAALYDRTLSGVRSLSTYVSGRRLRCEIDWLLRPGQRALYGSGQSLRVDYMNLYATIDGTTLQSYMDVGERV